VQIFTEMQRSASNDYTGRCNLLLATLYARGFGVQQDQRLIIDYLCKSAAFSIYARVLFWPIFRAMELDGFNGNLDDNRTIDIPQSTKIYERLQLMTYCERMRHVMYFRLILRLSPQSKHFFGRKFPYEIEVEDTGGFCYVRRLEDLEWLNIAPSAEGTPITFMCLGPLEREGPTAFLRLSMVAMDPRDINVINPRTTETPLITACRFGAEIEVIRLLHAGADPRIRDSCGFTPLHWLFRLSGPCQTLIAKLLIKNRADLNAVTTEEHILLEHGISLQFGCTPLHIAVIARSLETVQLLTALGADLEVAHKGRYPTTVLRFESYSLTPLHCAVSLRFPEIVKHLLDCGAVTDVAVKFPLYGAMTRNLLQILSIPFARGCETSPFARWILHGHDYKIDLKNTITTILSHNADIDKLGDDVRLEQSYPFASEGRIDVRWGAFLTNAAFVDDNTDVLETFLEQGIDLRRPSDCSEQEFVKGVLGYTLNGCTQGARKHPKLELVLGRTRCPSDIAFRILAHCAREDHVGAATSLLNHLNDLEIPPAVFHIAVEYDSADTLEALFRYSGTALVCMLMCFDTRYTDNSRLTK
jgi:Ankyrin repeats (3 copies)/Ankyrin repeat